MKGLFDPELTTHDYTRILSTQVDSGTRVALRLALGAPRGTSRGGAGPRLRRAPQSPLRASAIAIHAIVAIATSSSVTKISVGPHWGSTHVAGARPISARADSRS